jgi:hypothetical protein
MMPAGPSGGTTLGWYRRSQPGGGTVPTVPVSRPRSIRVVRFLLVAIAVAGGLTVVTAPLAVIQLMDGNRVNLTDALFGIVEATVLGALCLLAGAGLVRGIGRGAPRARVLAWVAAAVIVAAELLEISTDQGQLPDFDNPLPGWYLPLHYTVEIACLAAVLAIAWLLRSQSASDFFDVSAPSTPADEARIWDISRIRR